jgi:hypothetical protein
MRTFDGILIEDKMMYVQNLNNAVKWTIGEIIENYYRWSDSIKMRNGKDGDFRDVQADEFKDGITYKENRKYTKIYTVDKWGQKSVWGFVVRDNDTVKCTHGMNGGNHFSRGDLLRARSWNQAETKYSIGNILHGTRDNVTKPNPDYPNYKTVWSGAR